MSDQSIFSMSQKIDQLQAKLRIATEALERIHKAADCPHCEAIAYTALLKMKGEHLPDTSIPKRKKVCLAENGLQSLMNTRCECIYCKKESEGDSQS